MEDAFEDPVLVSTPAGAPGAVVAAAGSSAGAGGGRLGGVLSIDYYNRTLSGWEPVVEPWRYVASKFIREKKNYFCLAFDWVDYVKIASRTLVYNHNALIKD